MSFLTSMHATSRLTALRPAYPAATTAFHTSVVRSGLKEGDHSRDDIHNIYENEKQGLLKSQKEGRNRWNQDLASESEAMVKADRGEVESEKDFRDLQDRTKDAASKKRGKD